MNTTWGILRVHCAFVPRAAHARSLLPCCAPRHHPSTNARVVIRLTTCLLPLACLSIAATMAPCLSTRSPDLLYHLTSTAANTLTARIVTPASARQSWSCIPINAFCLVCCVDSCACPVPPLDPASICLAPLAPACLPAFLPFFHRSYARSPRRLDRTAPHRTAPRLFQTIAATCPLGNLSFSRLLATLPDNKQTPALSFMRHSHHSLNHRPFPPWRTYPADAHTRCRCRCRRAPLSLPLSLSLFLYFFLSDAWPAIPPGTHIPQDPSI